MNETMDYKSGSGYSNEAVLRLQERRDDVAKAMRFVIIGAFCLIIPPVGIALIFIGYFKLKDAQKDMKALYKDAFVREPLANNFENVIYQPGSGFSLDSVKNFQLCTTGNRFYSEDYIRADYQGVNFEVAQVFVGYVDNSGDSSYSKTYFDGRMMVFNFPNKLVTSVIIYDHKFKNRAIKKKEVKKDAVELEAVQFNKDFEVYAPDQHDAFYLLTPPVMERLQALSAKYQGIAMNVTGSRVVLAFHEPGKNAFDSNISIGKVDIDLEMKKVQAEIDDIKAFITVMLTPYEVSRSV